MAYEECIKPLPPAQATTERASRAQLANEHRCARCQALAMLRHAQAEAVHDAVVQPVGVAAGFGNAIALSNDGRRREQCLAGSCPPPPFRSAPPTRTLQEPLPGRGTACRTTSCLSRRTRATVYLDGQAKQLHSETLATDEAFCVQLLRHAFEPACWNALD